MVLVTYDVSTVMAEGRRRLGRVAKACLDVGQRVQNSVFECQVDPAQWTALKLRLLELYEPKEDSLRFYLLGANWQRKVEHHGAKPSVDLEGPGVREQRELACREAGADNEKRRPLRGRRGLKPVDRLSPCAAGMSPPSRGARIAVGVY